MAYLAGNLHMDNDMILGSYHHLAAIGALALFLAEGALLGLSLLVGRRPRGDASLLEPGAEP